MRTAFAIAASITLGSWCLLVGAGCFGNDTTEFPPGLEPLEPNTAPDPAPDVGDLYPEKLSAVYGRDNGYHWGHGVGFVHAAPVEVWEALQDPLVIADRRTADDIWWDLNPEEQQYDYGFLLHYFVDDIINVEWDELYRYGVTQGERSAPVFAIARWQKVWGSEFIDLVEGSLIVIEVEPEITRFEIIQHLDATGSDTGTIMTNFADLYASLLARVRGEPLPEY